MAELSSDFKVIIKWSLLNDRFRSLLGVHQRKVNQILLFLFSALQCHEMEAEHLQPYEINGYFRNPEVQNRSDTEIAKITTCPLSYDRCFAKIKCETKQQQ